MSQSAQEEKKQKRKKEEEGEGIVVNGRRRRERGGATQKIEAVAAAFASLLSLSPSFTPSSAVNGSSSARGEGYRGHTRSRLKERKGGMAGLSPAANEKRNRPLASPLGSARAIVSWEVAMPAFKAPRAPEKARGAEKARTRTCWKARRIEVSSFANENESERRRKGEQQRCAERVRKKSSFEQGDQSTRLFARRLSRTLSSSFSLSRFLCTHTRPLSLSLSLFFSSVEEKEERRAA